VVVSVLILLSGSVHQSSEIKVIYIDEIIAEKENKERDFLGVQQVPPCGGGRGGFSLSPPLLQPLKAIMIGPVARGRR
jgi:hypothetical protein